MNYIIRGQSGVPTRCLSGEIRYIKGIIGKRYKSNGSRSKQVDEVEGSKGEEELDSGVDYLSTYNKISGTTRWEFRNTDLNEDHQLGGKKKKQYKQLDEVMGFDNEPIPFRSNGKFTKSKNEKHSVKKTKKVEDEKFTQNKSSQHKNSNKKNKKPPVILDSLLGIRKDQNASQPLKNNKSHNEKNDNTLNLQNEDNLSKAGFSSFKKIDDSFEFPTNTQSTNDKKDLHTDSNSIEYDFNTYLRLSKSHSKLGSNLQTDIKQKIDPKPAVKKHTTHPMFKKSTNLNPTRNFSTSSIIYGEPLDYLKKIKMMKNFMKDYDYSLEKKLPRSGTQRNSKTSKYFARDESRLLKSNYRKDFIKDHQKSNNLEKKFKSNDEEQLSQLNDSIIFSNLGIEEISSLIPRPEFPQIGKVKENVNHIYDGWKNRDEYNQHFQKTFSKDLTYLRIQNKNLGKLSIDKIKPSTSLMNDSKISSILKQHNLVSDSLQKGDIVKFINPLYYLGKKGIIICDSSNTKFQKILQNIEIPKGKNFQNHYVVLVIRTGFKDFLDPLSNNSKGFYTKKHSNIGTSKIIQRRRRAETKLYHPQDPYFFDKSKKFIHGFFEITDPFFKPLEDEISINSQKYFGGFLDVVPKASVIDTGYNSNLQILDDSRLLDSLLDVIESPIVEREIIKPELEKAIFEPDHAYLFSGEGEAFEVRDY
ncbi:hypothetical protein BN7_6511 [Wickerhamomyces ciferrii]|uniref:Uncharacterized protein n=1 Tax=Wickerhamomyces ciferrii (strain ATCC 14091 / BCRC 22168 / CBS 111 / JCM 3599 / NBRC 0793 / NRRL Y-1031 F-60-10) TaxID=1206466 RepID=K0KUN4_WICCF|nr:uncharacterized protein BN7_6511 [Wickerhamomyces ciferrii]CCH46906.1 hypothetical protein BN7_6511 [Wickerhamomyces ciferrii]